MTLLTALELKFNYPNEILVSSDISKNGKYASFCYRLKNGEIHKLMLSTEYTHETAEQAIEVMHTAITECIATLNK